MRLRGEVEAPTISLHASFIVTNAPATNTYLLCMIAQAYTRRLAQLLLETQPSKEYSHQPLAHLQQCSTEMMALFLCFCAGNPKNKADLLALDMQDGSVHPQPVPQKSCDELLVSKLASAD